MNSIPDPKSAYVRQVLELYLSFSETPARYSRIDRRLAEEFYDRRFEIEQVESAMYLAIGRRLMRDQTAPKLGPIRSLHYFLPVIEEVRSVPLSLEYRNYLRQKVESLHRPG
jgi:hypothetical protein